jgi:ABC-type dipeptide/oligopeptide/nickel transport system permease subunit
MSVGSPGLLIEADDAIGPSRSEASVKTQLGMLWGHLRADRVALTAAGIAVLLILLGILASAIVSIAGLPHPNASDAFAHDAVGNPTGPRISALWPFVIVLAGVVLAPASRLLPWTAARRYGWLVVGGIALLAAIALAIAFWPSTSHLFGVDKEYRDVFSRALYGLRTSVEVGLIASLASVVIGVGAGVLAGYFGGWADVGASWVMEVLLAVPVLLLAVGAAAACKLGNGCLGIVKPGLIVVIGAISLASWASLAQVVRRRVSRLRELQSAHFVSNLFGPIVVYASVILGQSILFEASLSFLGVGVRQDQISLGAMLGDASDGFSSTWWSFVFPGAAITLTLAALSLFSGGLRKAFR